MATSTIDPAPHFGSPRWNARDGPSQGVGRRFQRGDPSRLAIAEVMDSFAAAVHVTCACEALQL